jgi:hypothetical protein
MGAVQGRHTSISSTICFGISAVASPLGQNASAVRVDPEPKTDISENPAARNYPAIVSLLAKAREILALQRLPCRTVNVAICSWCCRGIAVDSRTHPGRPPGGPICAVTARAPIVSGACAAALPFRSWSIAPHVVHVPHAAAITLLKAMCAILARCGVHPHEARKSNC